MSDKKFTPREAAIEVLKKAEELYKNSNLAKGDWAKIHNKLEREGYSKESADKIDGAIKAKVDAKKMHKEEPAPAPAPSPSAASKIAAGYGNATGSAGISNAMGNLMGKSDAEGHNPDEKADADLGEKVEQDVKEHEEHNEDPGHEMPMKGHIKLAKFMGRMEHKRGMKA